MYLSTFCCWKINAERELHAILTARLLLTHDTVRTVSGQNTPITRKHLLSKSWWQWYAGDKDFAGIVLPQEAITKKLRLLCCLCISQERDTSVNEVGSQSSVECNSEKCWFCEEGSCCNTQQCVIFCWCNRGRSQLEGKAVLLQKPTL